MYTREELLKVIETYGELTEGWDGDNSVPPTQECMAAARHMVTLFSDKMRLPAPMIGYDGHIGFWWNEPKVYVDIELEPENQFSMFSMFSRVKPDDTSEWYPDVKVADVSAEWFDERLLHLFKD